MWLGWLVGVRAELWGRAGQVQAEARARLVLRSLLLHCKALLPTFRPSSHVLGALTPQKPMGNPRLAALLLPLIGLSASAGIGCSYLPCWSTRCLLASRMDSPRKFLAVTGRPGPSPQSLGVLGSATAPAVGAYVSCQVSQVGRARDGLDSKCVILYAGLQWGWFHLVVQKSKKSYKFRFRSCRTHRMPTSTQRKLLSCRCLFEKGHHISVPSPDTSHKGLRSKRMQPSDPEAVEGLSKPDARRLGGPEFSFDLLPEARAIQVTVPPGPEVSVRLCHQWALECEELSHHVSAQKIVSGGHTVELSYEFLLPCLCIEVSYLQEDGVRRKKCPFQSWPEAYGSDFWESVTFTDYSQHSQMVIKPTLHCPVKLEASLCQRQGWNTICEDIPNATAQESEGQYVLEKVDLHPQLCFKFSFRNSSHVECPRRTGLSPDALSHPLAAPSWNVSMDTQAQQLILHFSSRMRATFSAAWSHPGLGQDSWVPPVYSISQLELHETQTLGWRNSLTRETSLLQPHASFHFPWEEGLPWLTGVGGSVPSGVEVRCPVCLEAPLVSRRHLGLLILALLAFTTLLGVVMVLTRWRPLSGKRLVRRKSSLPSPLPGQPKAPYRLKLHPAWAQRRYCSCTRRTPRRSGSCRLCAKGDIPPPLRALPRYRLLHDLPRLLRALDACPSTKVTDGDVLCLPGSIVSAPGPVLVPTRLQTELVLRCHEETDCDLCVRVVIHLAVHGSWEEPEDEEKFGGAADAELEEHRNASLQAHVVLSFQAYPTARCVLLEVQVPAALVQPGQPVGSVVFDCFEAALGAEVRIWSYTQPRYQKELNLTQQLPDGEDVRLVLDVSEEQRFGLSLYWNQAQGPAKPWWHRNLTGPQTITLNHTDLVPCLCIQVWPLEPDSVRTSICPFKEDPRAHRNLWRAARLHLLPPQGWRLDAPCSLPAEATLCWQALDGGPCQPLVPPLPRENVTVNKALEFPLLKGHPNIYSLGPLKDDMLLVETRGPQDNRSLCALEASGCTPLLSGVSTRAARLGEQLLQDLRSGQCLQLWDDDLGALWACPMDKYVHQRWALVWLACLLLAAVLFLLLLLKKNHVKGWLRLLKEDVRVGGGAGGEMVRRVVGGLECGPNAHPCLVSETRLVEVLEGVCSKSDFECHRLLELSEELVESWWFHKQQEAPDLFQWLCSDSLKLCCPPGTFGPSCLPCPGGAEQPCGGHGQCEGEGTRGGSGHCDCQAGYGGEACGQCGLGYFEAERNASHLVCSACFGPCARCSGPEESNCLQCKKGWTLHHLKCVDIDECGTERASCGPDQFCVNTEGSYECRDCAKACLGCMGAGPGRCKRCSPGYQQVGSKCLDVDECETVVCPGENEQCENTEGSYRCVCAEGYKQMEGICVKEQIPESAGFFSEMTEDELVVLQQMFFGVIICALATLAAKGDLVFTAIFIGAVAAMTGYWLSERSDRVLEGFIKGR
ncbi:hypothetical protein CB1_000105016 [Camelus ferus]|nr:hypothetical protein CB1_000105016 [Camelus ferus]